MKKQIKPLLCFAFFALLWSNTLSSQSCMGVEVKVGSGYETASYNAKGKIQGTSVVTFKEIRTENDFSVLDIEIESKTSKGKSNGKTSYTAKCNSNQIIVDSKSMISDEQKQMLAPDPDPRESKINKPADFEIPGYPGRYSVNKNSANV